MHNRNDYQLYLRFGKQKWKSANKKLRSSEKHIGPNNTTTTTHILNTGDKCDFINKENANESINNTRSESTQFTN